MGWYSPRLWLSSVWSRDGDQRLADPGRTGQPGAAVPVCIGVGLWGVLDGRADAVANPDPDRRQDLAMTWLLAGLLAGVLSGAVSWLIALLYDGLYTGGLISELTTFAAFTALAVFLPGVIGVAIGRWRVDRNPPAPGAAAAAGERAETDVFSAVRDDAPTGEVAPGHEAAGAPAATAVPPKNAKPMRSPPPSARRLPR